MVAAVGSRRWPTPRPTSILLSRSSCSRTSSMRSTAAAWRGRRRRCRSPSGELQERAREVLERRGLRLRGRRRGGGADDGCQPACVRALGDRAADAARCLLTRSELLDPRHGDAGAGAAGSGGGAVDRAPGGRAGGGSGGGRPGPGGDPQHGGIALAGGGGRGEWRGAALVSALLAQGPRPGGELRGQSGAGGL